MFLFDFLPVYLFLPCPVLSLGKLPVKTFDNVHNNIKFNFVKAYTCNYFRLVIGLKTDTKAGTPQ